MILVQNLKRLFICYHNSAAQLDYNAAYFFLIKKSLWPGKDFKILAMTGNGVQLSCLNTCRFPDPHHSIVSIYIELALVRLGYASQLRNPKNLPQKYSREQ